MLQPDTYVLLHRMLEVATTNDELEMMLKKFQSVYDATKESINREDLFDAAWAMSRLATLYSRLHEPFLAEHAYLESIKRFKQIGMALPAAATCEDLAKLLVEQGRTSEAEAKLEEEISCLATVDADENPVEYVEEELNSLRLTGKFTEACNYEWFLPYDVYDYGAYVEGEIQGHNEDGWTNQTAHR